MIDDYIYKEVVGHRMIGPLSSSQLSNGCKVHISLVPKGHNSGKWRLITDLSFPVGGSVNDGVDPQLCSLEYTSVDKVAKAVVAMGRGTLLAKIDIRSAYRLIPVHPTDRQLLGCKWRGNVYVDAMLPFGLRSAPKLFNGFADALEWIFRAAGISEVDHYLDDFGPPNSSACADDLKRLKTVAKCVGVPLAEDKTEGPTCVLTFLGIEIDSNQFILRLPQEKLARICKTLDDWTNRLSCRRRELESLVGLLQHAAKVVYPGRSFLHRMIVLLQGTRRASRFIQLNRGFKADLCWWKLLVNNWNGVSFLPMAQPSSILASDASGSWGCGAFSGNRWFQLGWPVRFLSEDITVKELIPIVVAVMVWGRSWRGTCIHCHCDNQAVVAVLATRYSRHPKLMQLLRCLFFLEAYHGLSITASHIPGNSNTLADYLSRNKLSCFFLQGPQDMSRYPTPLPLFALNVLLDPSIDWASETWMGWFSAIAI